MTHIRHLIVGVLLLLLSVAQLASQNIREDVRRARKVYRNHQYANAEVVYRKALAQDSTFTEARFGLAGAQYAQGRTDEALQEYTALMQDPTLSPKRRAELMHNLGNALMKKKDYRQSVEAYKHSLRLNPTDDETRYNLALAMKLLRNQQQQGGGGDDNQEQNQNSNQDKNQQQNNPNNNQGQQQPQPAKQDNTQQNKQDRQNEMSRESAEKILKAYEQDEEKTREKVEQMRKLQVKQQKGGSTKKW
ncbi:tetratricopeptide repeat protein [Porphyromonas loveana]|uniref:TPR repeat protein n=1 Tax=Porphyromonas loveana TaxID=1884669 RepID=A0A2U1FHD1_9PORP|nr:tetratricopeptide repeat protein [Porphyromonas loveana]PVZ11603.1 TPR repeat protein [Porphyromonas loveana]